MSPVILYSPLPSPIWLEIMLIAKIIIMFDFFVIQLGSKQKEILSNKDKSEEHKERIDAINEHLKNVLQELQHTQVLTIFSIEYF